MKNYTLLILLFIFIGNVNAQLLFDNGPLINYPNAGTDSAHVSAIHSGLITWGSNHSILHKYRVADEFTIPENQIWTIDSIVFFAYQTNSNLESTMNNLHLQIWEGSPISPEGFVLIGDSTTNMLTESYWSGIYRTTDDQLWNTQRPLMKNVVNMSALILQSGTYWLDWSTGGTMDSGPWVPIITIPSQTTTGNALQYYAQTATWYYFVDGGTSTAQGFPFLIYGSSVTDIIENEKLTAVNLFPNPFSGYATVKVSSATFSENGYAFIIYDMLGKEVKSKDTIKSTQFTIDGSDLNKGVYIYQLYSDKQLLKTGKLIVD